MVKRIAPRIDVNAMTPEMTRERVRRIMSRPVRRVAVSGDMTHALVDGRRVTIPAARVFDRSVPLLSWSGTFGVVVRRAVALADPDRALPLDDILAALEGLSAGSCAAVLDRVESEGWRGLPLPRI